MKPNRSSVLVAWWIVCADALRAAAGAVIMSIFILVPGFAEDVRSEEHTSELQSR